MDVPVHREGLADRFERLTQSVESERLVISFDVHPHEEAPGVTISELLAVGDIAAVLGQEASDGVDDAEPVGTGQREDEAVHETGPFSESAGYPAYRRRAQRRSVSQNSA
jgi:hypothetical protein